VKDQKDFENLNSSQIAIIGMAGRFPGAPNVDVFWNNLRNGVESVTSFTDEQLLASGVSREALTNKNYVKARPVLEGVELFDAKFFGLNPREAQGMDPQHRLFMECVWEAIESAGYDAESYKGVISLYAGSSMSSYLINNLYANPEALALVGEYESFLHNVQDSLATLIAYKLNLKGASYTVTTFCSTSLVNIHMACQSLLNFECDMAVAGGVTIFIPQNTGYWYQEGLIVSPDGHCRPFDAKAKGTVFGNGVGAVVLKRLEDALADGDHIEAVILGSATNNDGSLKASYTAPSVAGQSEVIAEAQANSGVEPDTITYVEAHGTATTIGDPMEVTALTRAFLSGTKKKGFCAIGSVKSNIGHLDAASGVAGLIKTVLALKHKEIPPSLHFEKPNPNIDFENSPFYVNTKLSEWKVDGFPRRAGVSCFGIGGTNAHVILQEAPVIKPSSASRPHQLLVLSAKSSTALEAATKNIRDWFKVHPDLNLADVAYTLQVGRKAFDYRRMIVSQDLKEAVSTLETADPKRVLTVYQEKRNPPVVFMFPGQGSQYVNMGLELYKTESIFREEVDRCCEILQPHLGLDLHDILYPNESDAERAEEQLTQTFITQPALFTIEYALAKLWMSWGVHPETMVGHSIGEYVAACLAGVFSLEDALTLVATRSRLIQGLPGGSMLAVPLTEKEVQPFLNQRLSLSVINSPSFCVVSGEKEAIEDLKEELSKKSLDYRPLHTSHAFHSKMMGPILDAFTEKVKQISLSAPQIPLVSNLTGTWLTSEEAMSPSYWARHLRHTVRFSDCVQELLKEPKRVFLEVGPGHTLSTFVKQHVDGAKGREVLSSVRHPKEDRSDIAFILNTLGRLWLAGVQVGWSGFYRDERRHRVHLPIYPFERQRYWVEPVEQPRGYFASQAGLSKTEDNFERPVKAELVSDYPASGDPGFKNNYEAPQNEIERIIAEIWQKLLGVKQIGINDNYFDLGGNSLMAVRLFTEIDKIFDRKLSIATLFKAPTVGQLAGILSNNSRTVSRTSLVEIQSGGLKPPLFFIHAAGGNVLIYRDLARHLGTDQPIYGLQAQGLDGEQPIHLRIEDMATKYVQEIQIVQPEGPYLLVGYCMGGTIALEMAQQLQAQGKEVALLVLMETYNFSKMPNSLLDKIRYRIQQVEFHGRNLFLSDSKMTFLGEKVKVAWSRKDVLFGKALLKLGLDFHLANEHYPILAKIWEACDQAALNYVPKVYPGRIIQFRPKKPYACFSDPELGWDKLTAGGLETYDLPVYPRGMLVEPFVKLLAEKLKVCIWKALELREKEVQVESNR
jgi:phthiocerol/phenolphthiocerol synthesis type-I polyketide synthase E